jgi:hypothetical protein
MTTANIDLLLSRLEGVKQTAPNKWFAKCPAHDDRSPSLSIRLTDEGTILIKDFGGCDTGGVLAAVGLTFLDLFPVRTAANFDSSKPRPKTPRLSKSELFDLLLIEAVILAIAFDSIRNYGSVSTADAERAQKAFDCVMRLHCEVYS